MQPVGSVRASLAECFSQGTPSGRCPHGGAQPSPVRRKRDGGVESKRPWVNAISIEIVDNAPIRVAGTELHRLATPDIHCSLRFGQIAHPIHEKQRATLHPNKWRIGEHPNQPSDVPEVVRCRVGLVEEDVIVSSVPPSGPSCVAQHKQIGNSGSPDRKTSSNGRSSSRRPSNQ